MRNLRCDGNPCGKDCERRWAECRLTCSDYKEYHEKKLKEYEEKAKIKDIDDYFWNAWYDRKKAMSASCRKFRRKNNA